MDYQRIYEEIIKSRRDNVPEGYSERHHVVPKSFGGTDDPSNIVRLTAREHFLCHWLLTKIHQKGRLHYKAMHAFVMIAWHHSDKQDRYRCTSRLYEKLKNEHKVLMSRSQLGDRNSQYGTMWINNGVESKKVQKDTEIEEGWVSGRVKKPVAPKVKKKRTYTTGDFHKLRKKEQEFIDHYLRTGSMNKAMNLVIGRNACGEYYHWAKKVIENLPL